MMTDKDTDTDTDTVAASSDNSKTVDEQTIAALQCLHHHKTVLETKLGATKKSWSDRLKESTIEFHGLIRDPVPSDDLCPDRVRAIKSADEDHQGLIDERDQEISKIKSKISECDSAFYDVLRRSRDPNQVNLNYGSEDGGIDPEAGIMLPAEHLKVLNVAARSMADNSEEVGSGVTSLLGRLDELGVGDMGFPAEPTEAPALTLAEDPSDD